MGQDFIALISTDAARQAFSAAERETSFRAGPYDDMILHLTGIDVHDMDSNKLCPAEVKDIYDKLSSIDVNSVDTASWQPSWLRDFAKVRDFFALCSIHGISILIA